MDIHSIHNIFIILHSASAVISFFAGFFLILALRDISHQGLFGLYWWSLVGMGFLLVGAIFAYWTEYSNLERIIFSGLLGLVIYMLYRARSAQRLLALQPADWKHEYIKHIGFTLISLFEGFIIVSGLNSGFPGWIVALLAILGVLVGRYLIGFTQRRAAS